MASNHAIYRPVIGACRMLCGETRIGSRRKASAPDGGFMFHDKIKIVLSVSSLIIAGSIFYSLVVFLPQKEGAKQEQQKTEKKQRDAETNADKFLLGGCLETAKQSYLSDWANNCQTQTKVIDTGLQNCLSVANQMSYESNRQIAIAQCKNSWGSPDYSNSCSLSVEIANLLIKTYNDSNDRCYKLYK